MEKVGWVKMNIEEEIKMDCEEGYKEYKLIEIEGAKLNEIQ